MTYQSDPTRWTQSPGEAPELLRGSFEAASREGPSDLQMRALALKLAAVGTGAAVGLGAVAGTQAASTTAAGAGLTTAAGGAALSTGSALTFAKIAVSAVLIGAAATGGTFFMRRLTHQDLAQQEPAEAAQVVERQAVAPAHVREAAVIMPAAPFAAPVEQKQAPVPVAAVERSAPAETTQAANAQAVAEQHESGAREAAPVAEQAEPSAAPSLSRAERRERRQQHAEAQAATQPTEAAQANRGASTRVPAVENVTGSKARASEIDLLSKARAALAARPREAYRLAEEHKALYPQGMFGQERDALAVEALQRAGELKHARALAEVFVKQYPSSPHAHRFRETMNIP
jgi:hypothetical protein